MMRRGFWPWGFWLRRPRELLMDLLLLSAFLSELGEHVEHIQSQVPCSKRMREPEIGLYYSFSIFP